MSDKQWKDGLPCNHPGCLSHISHPCEGCGRIGGKYPMDIIADFRAQLEAAYRGLASLTPGGSEFHNDIQNCVDYVKNRVLTLERLVKEHAKRRIATEADRDNLQAAYTMAQEAYKAACAVMDFMVMPRSYYDDDWSDETTSRYDKAEKRLEAADKALSTTPVEVIERDEPFTDTSGNVWARPTAEEYARVCILWDKWRAHNVLLVGALQEIKEECAGVISEPGKLKWCRDKEWIQYLQTISQKALSTTANEAGERVRGLVEALESIASAGTCIENDVTVSMTMPAIKAKQALAKYRGGADGE